MYPSYIIHKHPSGLKIINASETEYIDHITIKTAKVIHMEYLIENNICQYYLLDDCKYLVNCKFKHINI
jgi:hypothetical protein